MSLSALHVSLFDELQKIAERKKPMHEKVVDTGAPILAGAGVGKSLADLSFSKMYGASPRRKTLGAILGALGGASYLATKHQRKSKRKSKESISKVSTALPMQGLKQGFMGAPGKKVSSLVPKVGKIGTLPQF